jgi:hypothetical protein
MVTAGRAADARRAGRPHHHTVRLSNLELQLLQAAWPEPAGSTNEPASQTNHHSQNHDQVTKCGCRTFSKQSARSTNVDHVSADKWSPGTTAGPLLPTAP